MPKWTKYLSGVHFLHRSNGEPDSEIHQKLRTVLDDPKLKDCKIKWREDSNLHANHYHVIITNPHGVKVSMEWFCREGRSWLVNASLWHKKPIGPRKTRYFKVSTYVELSNIPSLLSEKRASLDFSLPVRTFSYASDVQCWRYGDNRVRADWNSTFYRVFVDDLVGLDGWKPCKQTLARPGTDPWFLCECWTPDQEKIPLLYREENLGEYLILSRGGKHIITDSKVGNVDLQYLNTTDRQLIQAAANAYMNHIILKE